MPTLPPADHPSSSQDGEDDHLEMERDWQLRQQNVLPLETAWNEGRFYGLVLKGNQRLTGVQRAGILVLGLLAIGAALITFPMLERFHGVGPSINSTYWRRPDVVLSIPVIVLEFALGLRFCWVALKRSAHDRHAPHSHHQAK